MSFNEDLKNISIKEVLFVIIFSYILAYAFKSLIGLNQKSFYVILILYFVFRLRNSFADLKLDFKNVFSEVSFVHILGIVVLNILFSYGMLYLAKFGGSYIEPFLPFKSFAVDYVGWGSLLSIVVISPIVEELIFRGVFLNKLELVVPTTFAILISSLLFASLHSFGSIFSAFIFGICMAILYLKSENILVPILAHFLNNGIGESIYHLDTASVLFNNDMAMGIMSVLSVISFIIILKFIISNWNTYK